MEKGIRMTLKGGQRVPIKAADQKITLPVIPAKTVILFPGEVITLQVGRPENIALIQENSAHDHLVAVVYSPRGESDVREVDLCRVGTAAHIISIKDGPAGSKIISLEGSARIVLERIRQKAPYITGTIGYVNETPASPEKAADLTRQLIAILEEITKLDPSYSDELSYVLKFNLGDPGRFADKVAAALHLPLVTKQKILEAYRIDARLTELLQALQNELERARVLYEVKKNVDERAVNEQRKSYLRQQLYEIKRQLGEEFIEDKIAQQLRNEIKKNRNLPPGVRDRALIEIDRLSHLSTASAEYGATKLYLDWLMNIPWNIFSPEDYNLRQVEAEIDEEYYGSPQIKKQILERLAVRQLSGGVSEGSVLCIAGVPGTGKASLARAIARALGKKFIRISVGGMIDISDIKGSARNFLGAAPGIIIRTLRDAGVSDPVVFIEDIEYFAQDANTALPMSLLEAIDPRLNGHFLDNYIGLPINLHRAIFICAVKSIDGIPEMLAHRFEIIELPGYIEREKIHIARKYIIPKVLTAHGLKKKDINFTDNGLKKIIRSYTLEAGLLNLRRQLERICRHVAKEKASRLNKIWTVNEKTVESFLGTPQFIPEKPEKKPEIGVAIGLAWTGMGGELMMIEGLRMKGSGEVITTGSLGEVMKESIQAAHSYVRARADILGIDHNDFDNFDIHIHFPSGAIPKDGPSAGVTVSLVIASVMAERPIRHDIAMTGEVTLRGKILPVGGIKEKISAAYRAGIPKILIPLENKKDLKDLPDDIIKKTKFIFINNVDEVFEAGLLDFVPSSYTLEKLFAEELEKAKHRKSGQSQKRVAAKSLKRP
jgi:ATP-dependent Lon protease